MAGTVYEIMGFGNSVPLNAILTGISALFGSGVMASLTKGVMLLGFTFKVFQNALLPGRSIENIVVYSTVGAALAGWVLVSTVSVVVIDPLNKEHQEVVDGIPWVVAAPIDMIGKYARTLSEQLSTAYANVSSVPTSLMLTGSDDQPGAPFNISAQLIEDASQYRITDPYLKNSLTHFVVNCVTPMIASNHLSTEEVLTSSNIWKLIKKSHLNKALLTLYFGRMNISARYSRGIHKTCDEAYDLIQTDLTAIKKEQGFTTDLFNRWGHDVTPTLAASLFNDVVSYMATDKSGSSPSPGEYLQQSAIIHLLSGPTQRLMANQTGSSSIMNAFAVGKADRETSSGWMTAGVVFQTTMGYIYSFLLVLIIGMMPVALLLMFVPGFGVRFGGFYLKLLTWYPLSVILLSMLNALMTHYTHNQLNPFLASAGGLSLSNYAMVSVQTAKLISVGGWVLSLTPMFAWACISGGSFAMTEFFNSTITRNAGANATEISASGNVSADNQRYADVSANHTDTAVSTRIGASPVESRHTGGASNDAYDVGGTSVQRNMASAATQFVQTTTTQQQTYAGSTDSTSSTQAYSDMSSLHEQAQSSASSINSLTSYMHTAYRGGLATAGVTALLQKNIEDNNYSMSESDVAQLSESMQSIAMTTTSAAQAASNGNTEESEGLLASASKMVTDTHDYLTAKFGGGSVASKSAWAVMAVGATGATLAALPEEASAAVVAGAAAGFRAVGGYLTRAFSMASGGAVAEEAMVAGAMTAEELQAASLTTYSEYAALGGAEAGAGAVGAAATSSAAAATKNIAKAGFVGGVAKKAYNAFAEGLSGAEGYLASRTEGTDRASIESSISAGATHQGSSSQSAVSQDTLGQQVSISSTTTQVSSWSSPNEALLSSIGGNNIKGASAIELASSYIQEQSSALSNSASNVSTQVRAHQEKVEAMGQSINQDATSNRGIPGRMSRQGSSNLVSSAFDGNHQ